MSSKHIVVTGASGYIGLAIARALRGQGHIVYGNTRSQTQAEVLEKHEIIPIVCALNELPSQIKMLGVSVIVEAHTPTEDACDVTSQLLGTLDENGRYMYCSGCLVYGDRPGEECLESDAVPDSRRAQVEFLVLKHHCCGTVFRPAFVYGGSGGHYASRWWNPMGQAVVVHGQPDKTWAWVHVDDIAAAFALALDAKEDVVRSQIFNLSDGSKTVFKDLVTQMARMHTKRTDLEICVAPAETPFDKAFDKSCFYQSERAARLLGWKPSRIPFIDALDIYYRSWRASL